MLDIILTLLPLTFLIAVALITKKCVMVPFSSWVAFTVGLLSGFGLTFGDYISSIPFMFYPVLMFCLLFLLALGVFPKLGTLKHSYERVAGGGPGLDSARCSFHPCGLYYICHRRMLGNADNRNSYIYSGCNGHGRSCKTGYRSYHECCHSWL